jgi:glucuronokinase
MIINTKSYPRAALIGNPSDGYFGKTIAFIFRNFSADVMLYQTPELEIFPAELDSTVFDSIHQLARDVRLNGYYGGFRLLKAAIKRFYEYCEGNNIELDDRNFTIRYRSNIPIRLGLAGSSAIITACMRALMSFYGIQIPKPLLANLILSVETEELNIGAGLQDRVAQVYEHPVFMNFDKKIMDKQGYGDYIPLNIETIPNLYIAYRTDLSEGSEMVHNNFRERFNYNEPEVVKAINEWSDLTSRLKVELENGNNDKIGALLNRNFDIRGEVMNLSEKNIKMVELARSAGASAKFTGSGGAIIGTYEDEKMYNRLKNTLNNEKIEILKPEIVKQN